MIRKHSRLSGHLGPLLLAAVPLLACLLAAGNYLAQAGEVEEQPSAGRAATESSSDAESTSDTKEPLTPPRGWPKGHPLPTVRSNCMECHLKAGRELTLAVRDFSHSVHDLNGLTCYDCHGGNPDDDASAHEEEFDFIGTKLSAHLKQCSSCHDEPAQHLASGPHHWDFSKRINTKYPMCIDCHGNHDVGNPPSDFTLLTVCQDCHEELEKDYPAYAQVVSKNDALWSVMSQVRERCLHAPEPMPEQFQAELDALRTETMRCIHEVGQLSPAEAKALADRTEALQTQLQEWLDAQSADEVGNKNEPTTTDSE
jgi:formate-dependent nitrite reductase cytochrome c552 subunit